MSLVESSWDRLRDGLVAKGFSDREIKNFRTLFAAGVYVASVAIEREDARAADIADAAYRVELKALA